MVSWNICNRGELDITKESKPISKAIVISLKDLKSEKIDPIELMKAKERIRKANKKTIKKYRRY